MSEDRETYQRVTLNDRLFSRSDLSLCTQKTFKTNHNSLKLRILLVMFERGSFLGLIII